MGLAGDGVPVAQDRYLNIGLGYILQGWVSSIRYDSVVFFLFPFHICYFLLFYFFHCLGYIQYTTYHKI